MTILSLAPSEIRYSQDSIASYFHQRSRHPGVSIGETLDNLICGRCSVYDIPEITVQYKDRLWYTADNRRLWVFRNAAELGAIHRIPAFEGYIDPSKFTTYNDGESIRVRGDPGGTYWRRKRRTYIPLREPTPEPKPATVVEMEAEPPLIKVPEPYHSPVFSPSPDMDISTITISKTSVEPETSISFDKVSGDCRVLITPEQDSTESRESEQENNESEHEDKALEIVTNYDPGFGARANKNENDSHHTDALKQINCDPNTRQQSYLNGGFTSDSVNDVPQVVDISTRTNVPNSRRCCRGKKSTIIISIGVGCVLIVTLLLILYFSGVF